MELSPADQRLVIEALDQLDAEYGRPDAVKLADRLRAERKSREADLEPANDVADMIADWYGRSPIDADRELAQQIIDRVRAA